MGIMDNGSIYTNVYIKDIKDWSEAREKYTHQDELRKYILKNDNHLTFIVDDDGKFVIVGEEEDCYIE